jgi:hypothetical protein
LSRYRSTIRSQQPVGSGRKFGCGWSRSENYLGTPTATFFAKAIELICGTPETPPYTFTFEEALEHVIAVGLREVVRTGGATPEANRKSEQILALLEAHNRDPSEADA